MDIPLICYEEQASACLKDSVTLRPELLRYARKLTNGDEEKAQDLVQEAALRLHEGVQRRGTPTGQLKPRLFAVIRNVHVDEQRRAGRIVSIDSHNAEDGEPIEHVALQRYGEHLQTDAQSSAQTAQLADLAAQELASRFNLGERVLFRLTTDGYTSRDISELTGYSHSTACRQIRRVREHLQNYLRPLLGIL